MYIYIHIYIHTQYIWCSNDWVHEVRIPHLCRALLTFKVWWHSAASLVPPGTLWTCRTIIPNWQVRKLRAGKFPKVTKWAKGGVWTKVSVCLFLWLLAYRDLLSDPLSPSLLSTSSPPELVAWIPPKWFVRRMALATLKLMHSNRDRKSWKIKVQLPLVKTFQKLPWFLTL